ncbi:hypothetical protein GF359_06490, partial [candidate division WOR-3 bacterium]|nr:hypothetical protein [candidate division WOR-3 bacterium]MBD3364847.1 hypothetical protein [candidate division WOR-3 bacterium]
MRKRTDTGIIFALVFAACMLPASGQAFTSGSPFFAFGWHGRITSEALSDLGFSHKAINQIKRGNRKQDWDITPIRILDAKRHFCRDRNQSHHDAFERNKDYLEQERSRTIELLVDANPGYWKARRVFGWCLHTTQDAFS